MQFRCSFCTTALIIITNIIQGLVNFVPGDNTVQWSRWYNIIQGVNFCTTAATSVVATFIIAAIIHRSNINNGARRRYRHIIEITIQSSALYTLTIVGTAVTTLLDDVNLNVNESSIFNAGLYLSALTCIATVGHSQLSILNYWLMDHVLPMH